MFDLKGRTVVITGASSGLESRQLCVRICKGWGCGIDHSKKV